MPRAAARSATKGLAYSYLRFSHPDQAKGDTLRRQTENRDGWLKRNGVTLDTSLTLRDEGVSAFNGDHRDNPDRHAFVKLVEAGRIARGSYLIVESLDRLSREDIIPALSLLLNLIQAGIRIVQLLPVETVYDQKSNPMQLMMAIMELSRGHSESAMKSERVGGAWKEKKRLAAAEHVPLTARAPSWLRLVEGKWQVMQAPADAVRRIYRGAIDGYGIGAITKRLNAEKVPPIGRAKHWARSYVAKILTNSAVIGHYQPFKGRAGKRRPDGKVIEGYYPGIVFEEEWFAVRAALANRKNKAGRPINGHLNIFASLLRDARDGSSLHVVDKGKKNGGRLLVSSFATYGVEGSKLVSFPLPVFERAVLSCLREIDPREILSDPKPAHRAQSILGELTEVEGRIERLKQHLKTEEIDAVIDVLRELDGKRKALADELAQARMEDASPLKGAWQDCRNLAEAVDKAPDQTAARIKLRAAIRRIVEGAWCLFVGKGSLRIAAVQIFFTGGKRRDYVILHQPAQGGSVPTRAARWWVRSLATVVKAGELDLRKPEHARRLEKVLAAQEMER
jgi:DNA invertase Pin-like site-specific DNA recombinase